MEIKDLRVGDTVLIKYVTGKYIPHKITKTNGDKKFYDSALGYFIELSDTDVWLFDTPQGNELFSQSDILFIQKLLIIIGVSMVAIIVGQLIV